MSPAVSLLRGNVRSQEEEEEEEKNKRRKGEREKTTTRTLKKNNKNPSVDWSQTAVRSVRLRGPVQH